MWAKSLYNSDKFKLSVFCSFQKKVVADEQMHKQSYNGCILLFYTYKNIIKKNYK